MTAPGFDFTLIVSAQGDTLHPVAVWRQREAIHEIELGRVCFRALDSAYNEIDIARQARTSADAVINGKDNEIKLQKAENAVHTQRIENDGKLMDKMQQEITKQKTHKWVAVAAAGLVILIVLL